MSDAATMDHCPICHGPLDNGACYGPGHVFLTSRHATPIERPDDLVADLRFLVSLNKAGRGGPYGGSAAERCMEAMTAAADEIERLRAREAAFATLIDAVASGGTQYTIDLVDGRWEVTRA